MNKQWLLIISILILLSTSIYAEEYVTIVNAEISSGETKEVEDKGGKLEYTLGSGYVNVKLPSGSGMLVKNGDCNEKEDYDVCLSDYEESHFDVDTKKTIYTATIDIVKIVPEGANLEIVKTVSKTDVIIGELITIDITLTNDGALKAKEIDFRETIPTVFEIIPSADFFIEYTSDDFTTLVWKGEVKKSDPKTLKYKIKPKEKISYQTDIKFSYHDGIKRIDDVITNPTIDVGDFEIEFNITFDQSKISQDELAKINIGIKNLNEDNLINVEKLEVVFPIGLEHQKKSTYLQLKDNTFTWSGGLDPLASEEFYIDFQGKFIDIHIFDINIDYINDNVRQSISKSFDFEVTGEIIYYETDVAKTLQPGEEHTFFIEVKNPSDSQKFKNVKLLVDSPLGISKTEIIGDLDPLANFKLESISFTAPEVDTFTKFPINITLSSIGKYDQLLKTRSSEIINVGDESTTTEIIILEDAPKNKTSEDSPEETEEKIGFGIIDESQEIEGESDLEETTDTKASPVSSNIVIILIVIGTMTFILVGIFVFRKYRTKTSPPPEI